MTKKILRSVIMNFVLKQQIHCQSDKFYCQRDEFHCKSCQNLYLSEACGCLMTLLWRDGFVSLVALVVRVMISYLAAGRLSLVLFLALVSGHHQEKGEMFMHANQIE